MDRGARESAIATRVAVTGVSTLGAGNAVALVGIYVPAVLTGQQVQLWTGTAGAVTGITVIGTASLAANTFHRIPGLFPGGLTYCVTNEDVDLTFFWLPATG